MFIITITIIIALRYIIIYLIVFEKLDTVRATGEPVAVVGSFSLHAESDDTDKPVAIKNEKNLKNGYLAGTR